MSESPTDPFELFLEICDSVCQRAADEGADALSPIERTVLRSYVFDADHHMGGLTSFFYNTDSSPEIAAETAAALGTIGAHDTAALFRQAAALICHPELQQGASTWGECLQRVDPDGQLDGLSRQILHLREGVCELLESFVFQHLDALKRSSS